MTDTSLTGKRALFLLADGFSSERFNQMHRCLFGRGAQTVVAGPVEGSMLTSSDDQFAVHSDYSFASAGTVKVDAVILADDATADAIRDDDDARALLQTAWERGDAVVAIGAGVLNLLAAEIVEGGGPGRRRRISRRYPRRRRRRPRHADRDQRQLHHRPRRRRSGGAVQ